MTEHETRYVKLPDGEIVDLRAAMAVSIGWDALILMARSHDDGMVRIAAAEKLIRLGAELAPKLDFVACQKIAAAIRKANA